MKLISPIKEEKNQVHVFQILLRQHTGLHLLYSSRGQKLHKEEHLRRQLGVSKGKGKSIQTLDT